jgi:glycosyltransferase involved in cell wall biosynthesis
LIGDGPEKERLKHRVRSEAIKCVSFEDPVPKNRIYALLAEADCFVVILARSPLYQWGMSLNKIFDYMAMGRPTIIATGGSYNPITEAGAGMSVETGSAGQLAEAIVSVACMDQQRRRAMGARGRQYVEVHHDLARLTALMEGVLAKARSNVSQS